MLSYWYHKDKFLSVFHCTLSKSRDCASVYFAFYYGGHYSASAAAAVPEHLNWQPISFFKPPSSSPTWYYQPAKVQPILLIMWDMEIRMKWNYRYEPEKWNQIKSKLLPAKIQTEPKKKKTTSESAFIPVTEKKLIPKQAGSSLSACECISLMEILVKYMGWEIRSD